MLIAEARVPTDRSTRYLVQLCRHLSNEGRHLSRQSPSHPPRENDHQPPRNARVEWSDTDGLVEVGWGRCILRAGDDLLLLRAEAADEEGLRRVQELIGGHLTRFSNRDPLEVTWRRCESSQV